MDEQPAMTVKLEFGYIPIILPKPRPCDIIITSPNQTDLPAFGWIKINCAYNYCG